MKEKQEYLVVLGYLRELEKIYDKDGNLTPGKRRNVPVLGVWRDLIRQAIREVGIEDEVYRVVAKDFQRFFNSYFQFANILETMWNSSEKERYAVLIRKIATEQFFTTTFHDDSQNFFKLRKWIQERIESKELKRKLNSHLNCIIHGLFNQLKRRYGLS